MQQRSVARCISWLAIDVSRPLQVVVIARPLSARAIIIVVAKLSNLIRLCVKNALIERKSRRAAERRSLDYVSDEATGGVRIHGSTIPCSCVSKIASHTPEFRLQNLSFVEFVNTKHISNLCGNTLLLFTKRPLRNC